jgi:hypothetical protein
LLSEKVQGIYRAINQTHDKAHPPKPGSTADSKARDALAKLVRIDSYTEQQVVDTLRWLLTDSHEDAEFWRQQVHTLTNLRKKKDGATKFTRIHEAHKRATATGNGKPVKVDPKLLAFLQANK